MPATRASSKTKNNNLPAKVATATLMVQEEAFKMKKDKQIVSRMSLANPVFKKPAFKAQLGTTSVHHVVLIDSKMRLTRRRASDALAPSFRMKKAKQAVREFNVDLDSLPRMGLARVVKSDPLWTSRVTPPRAARHARPGSSLMWQALVLAKIILPVVLALKKRDLEASAETLNVRRVVLIASKTKRGEIPASVAQVQSFKMKKDKPVVKQCSAKLEQS